MRNISAQETVEEVNLVRTNPASLVPVLQQLGMFNGTLLTRPGRITLQTKGSLRSF